MAPLVRCSSSRSRPIRRCRPLRATAALIKPGSMRPPAGEIVEVGSSSLRHRSRRATYSAGRMRSSLSTRRASSGPWSALPSGRRATAHDPELPLDLLTERTGELLEAVALRPLDRPLLASAGALVEPALRALDAVHVASAVDLRASTPSSPTTSARPQPPTSPVYAPWRPARSHVKECG